MERLPFAGVGPWRPPDSWVALPFLL